MIIGISGGSGVGKTTLSRRIAEILPNSLLINGDIFMHARSKQLEEKILSNIGVKKESNIFSYNYYLESFENTKTWVETIENEVISDIKNVIIEKGKNKEYIIVDWVFLPLCKWFRKCDTSICVTSNYNLRLKRLSKRLQDKSIYNEGDRSFWSYKPGIIEKRLYYTTLNERGYKSNYYVSNDGNIEALYNNIDILIDKIVKNKKMKEKNRKMELLDIYTENKELTGKTIERHENRGLLKEGEYFLFEQAWVLNSNREILLTRRAPNKKYAGMWEPTSGHVISGETSLNAIKRELYEEIGINIKDSEIKLVKSFIDKKSIKEIWVVKKDVCVEQLRFVDDEVSDAKFVTINEFKEMLKYNETFNNLEYFIELYKTL